jgi:hypothetical protein
VHCLFEVCLAALVRQNGRNCVTLAGDLVTDAIRAVLAPESTAIMFAGRIGDVPFD